MMIRSINQFASQFGLPVDDVYELIRLSDIAVAIQVDWYNGRSSRVDVENAIEIVEKLAGDYKLDVEWCGLYPHFSFLSDSQRVS
jgi:hypothetical protein